MNAQFSTPSGKKFDVLETKSTTGAWLMLSDKGDCLSVQETNFGGKFQTYAGYRDGVCQADKLAIIYSEGVVSLQVILSGEGDEFSRIRTVSIAELEALLGGK